MGALFASGCRARCALPLFFLLLIAGTASAGDCPISSFAERATVAAIVDGDTIALTDSRRVRLIGINTPELAHRGRAAQAYAERARAALAELLPPGTSIGLHPDVEHKDRYGRTLAHVALVDQTNINAVMLARGLATAWVIPPNARFAECYAGVERRARSAGVGIWSLPEYQPIASERVAAGGGFQLVQGRVERVERAVQAVQLELSGGVVLRIGGADLKYFNGIDLPSLRGRSLRVHAWVKAYRGRPMIRVRHPLEWEVVDAAADRRLD